MSVLLTTIVLAVVGTTARAVEDAAGVRDVEFTLDGAPVDPAVRAPIERPGAWVCATPFGLLRRQYAPATCATYTVAPLAVPGDTATLCARFEGRRQFCFGVEVR